MLISEQYGFIFFSNESTGSRSVYEVLVNQFGAREVTHKHGVLIPPESLERPLAEYLVLATCRDPFRRLISAFNRLSADLNFTNGYGKGSSWVDFTSFLYYVRDWDSLPAVHPEFDWCVPGSRWNGIEWCRVPQKQSDVINVITAQTGSIDALLKQESLQADFDQLPFVTSSIELPQIGVSEQPSDEHYTRVNFDIARRYLADEYELLGYAMPVIQ